MFQLLDLVILFPDHAPSGLNLGGHHNEAVADSFGYAGRDFHRVFFFFGRLLQLLPYLSRGRYCWE